MQGPVIQGDDPSFSGETNLVSNIGTGLGIFKQKTSVTFELRKLLAGTGISIAIVGDDIVITNDLTGAEIKTLYEAEANAFTDAQFTKLAGIEALADVTDATNVNSAGATMNADTDVKLNSYVIDEDTMVSNLDTKIPTQQSTKAYVDTEIASALTSDISLKGDYNASTNTPDLDVAPVGVSKGYHYVVSVAGTFFTEPLEVGDSIIAKQDNPTLLSHWIIAQANLTPATIKTQYESNADTNEFSDAEQTKLTGIETSATADQTDAEIETAYNTQVPIVSQADAEAGTSTTRKGWTPERVKQSIDKLSISVTPSTEQSNTPVVDTQEAAMIISKNYHFFTMPTDYEFFIITGIEWKNGATISGNMSCGVELVDADVPTLASSSLLAYGNEIAIAGADAVQRNSQIVSKLIPKGSILGLWIQADDSTTRARFIGGQSNNNHRKAFTYNANPRNVDNTAWSITTIYPYIKLYFKGIGKAI